MYLHVEEEAIRSLGVELVVVFGSRARGQARPDSDVDVGVLFGPGVGNDLEARLEAVRGLVTTSERLDLVQLNRADPLLLFEVAAVAKPVFEARPGVLEEFRVHAVKRYFDTEWLRRAEAAVLRARYG